MVHRHVKYVHIHVSVRHPQRHFHTMKKIPLETSNTYSKQCYSGLTEGHQLWRPSPRLQPRQGVMPRKGTNRHHVLRRQQLSIPQPFYFLLLDRRAPIVGLLTLVSELDHFALHIALAFNRRIPM